MITGMLGICSEVWLFDAASVANPRTHPRIWIGVGMSDRPVRELSFEEAMQELESVVRHLESGEVELEASIQLYERGAALKKRCEEKLREAEEKIAAITLNERGEPKGTGPIDDP